MWVLSEGPPHATSLGPISQRYLLSLEISTGTRDVPILPYSFLASYPLSSDIQFFSIIPILSVPSVSCWDPD